MSVPQERLARELEPQLRSGLVRITGNPSLADLVEQMGSRFPTDFPYVENAIRSDADEMSGSEVTSPEHAFWEVVVREANLNEESFVYALWDDANYVPWKVQVGLLRQRLDDFLLPPHFWVLAEDLSWAACFKTIGHFGFGWAEPR